MVDLELAPRIFEMLHAASERGLVRSCHDLSEGGLAVAVAEMAFAGDVGVDITDLPSIGQELSLEVVLFSESTTRFVVETTPANAQALRECLGSDIPVAQIGTTCKEPRLRIADANGEWILWAKLMDLKEAWQKPLRW